MLTGHVRKSVFRALIDAATVVRAEGEVPRWVTRLTSDVSGSPPDPGSSPAPSTAFTYETPTFEEAAGVRASPAAVGRSVRSTSVAICWNGSARLWSPISSVSISMRSKNAPLPLAVTRERQWVFEPRSRELAPTGPFAAASAGTTRATSAAARRYARMAGPFLCLMWVIHQPPGRRSRRWLTEGLDRIAVLAAGRDRLFVSLRVSLGDGSGLLPTPRLLTRVRAELAAWALGRSRIDAQRACAAASQRHWW